jgi:enoyl-CoA hydratase/carnithine racemase
MPEHLRVDHHGAVAVVAFHRPGKRNALTRDVLRLLPGLLHDLAREAAAVVLTGGSDVFSAGVDLSEIGHGVEDAEVDQEIAAVAAALRGLPVPVIAAVEGPCVGAAVELALACDARVVARDCFFSVPAVHLGALYRPEGIADVVRAVGAQTALRLLVLGERLSGDSASVTGLAAHVTEPGSALDRAIQLASRATPPGSAAADATKQVIQAVLRHEDLARFEALRQELLGSSERRAAVVRARATPDRAPRGRS